jgi:surface protein
MFAVEVCSLPVTGGATGVAVAAAFLLVLGVIVARWVRASAGRVSVVAVVPLLLLGIGAASTQASSTSCDSSTVTTTVPEVTAPTTTVAPTTTTTVVPVDPNLVLQISIPMSNPTAYVFGLDLAGTVNVSIDWGDNSTSVATTAGVVSHTYATSGQYEIRVSGTLTGFGQSPYSDSLVGAEYLVGVSSFGDLGLTSLDYAFLGAHNLVSVPSVLPSTVVSLEGTFMWADSFNHANIGAWDTSNVTDMSFMFSYASSFNQSLNSWDTTSVTDMSFMFYEACLFNGDVSNWDTSNVTNMLGMFSSTAFNHSLNSWDTGNVTNMNSMFNNALSFNGDVSNWDTGKVTDMNLMFHRAFSFNQDISDWDTSSVTDMGSMFRDATSFNQSLSTWVTSSVTDMGSMFRGATSFNQSLSSWNVSLVANMQNMLDNTALSSANYAATLIGWSSRSVKPNVQFGASGKSVGDVYSAGCDARELLEDSSSWIISDSSNCNP